MKYKKGYKYQLTKDHIQHTDIGIRQTIEAPFIKLYINGKLRIMKGYAWDGASGFTIDTKSSMRGSLVHDAMYQLMRMELLDRNRRAYIDELFYIILKQDGMLRLRAWYWYRAVRRFAAFASNPKNAKEEYTAP